MKVRNRSSIVWVGVIALLLTLSSVTHGEAANAPGELPRVRLATLGPSALLWLHAIAEDQGFYEDRGVDVYRVQVANSSVLVQAVSSGSAEAGVSLGDNVMKAVDQGAPIVISGAILHKPILRLIGDVDRPEDLAGAMLTAGAVTGGTTNLLLYQLQQFGVSRNEVQLLAIANSRDRLVGMQNGAIQGALLIAPFDVQAVRNGLKVLDVYRDYWLQTPLILNKEWADQNPEAAKGITQAFADAAKWIYEPANRDEAVQILAEFTGIELDIVDEAYEFIVVEQQAISPDLTVPAGSLRNILVTDQAVNGGEMPDFDLYRYYDPKYLNP